LFQGEEWGASSPFQYFVDFSDDPALASAVSEGRRGVFGDLEIGDFPDPQSEETFARSKLDWAEIDQPPHSEMLAWHQQLIELRRRTESLVDGALADVDVHLENELQCLTIRRGNYWLFVNLANVPRRIAQDVSTMETLLSSDQEIRLDRDGIMMPPECVAITEQRCASMRAGRIPPAMGSVLLTRRETPAEFS
jgi:maltooligosyltrehalose trehalohydrolase